MVFNLVAILAKMLRLKLGYTLSLREESLAYSKFVSLQIVSKLFPKCGN